MNLSKTLVAIVTSAGILSNSACSSLDATESETLQLPMKWGQVYFSSDNAESLLQSALCAKAGISDCDANWGQARPYHFVDVVKYADKNNSGIISEKEARHTLNYFKR